MAGKKLMCIVICEGCFGNLCNPLQCRPSDVEFSEGKEEDRQNLSQ